MAPGGAAFLRQATCVLGDDAFAFDVRRHAQQLADRDDARTAHARDHQAPYTVMRLLQIEYRRHRQTGSRTAARGLRQTFLFTQCATLHSDKAGAKTFDARNVFITRALVDAPFAAQLGFQWLHTHAIALHAAVAAAFADQFVNHHARGRVHQGAAFAAAALFGGAGLVVNNDGGAFDFAHHALHRVQAVAVLYSYTFGQAFDTIVFFGFVGHHHNALRTFGAHALRDLDHAVALGAFADLLAAGHGHRIVVQNFVGDIYTRRNRLAHRQQAAMEVRAIA